MSPIKNDMAVLEVSDRRQNVQEVGLFRVRLVSDRNEVTNYLLVRRNNCEHFSETTPTPREKIMYLQ